MVVPTLKEQRAADINSLYADGLPWVETAAPATGDPFSVRIRHLPENQDGKPHRRLASVVMVRKTDLPAPAVNQKLTINGEEWRVSEYRTANAWEWELALERDVRMGFGGSR